MEQKIYIALGVGAAVFIGLWRIFGSFFNRFIDNFIISLKSSIDDLVKARHETDIKIQKIIDEIQEIKNECKRNHKRR